jgi:hypothetical protein
MSDCIFYGLAFGIEREANGVELHVILTGLILDVYALDNLLGLTLEYVQRHS